MFMQLPVYEISLVVIRCKSSIMSPCQNHTQYIWARRAASSRPSDWRPKTPDRHMRWDDSEVQRAGDGLHNADEAEKRRRRTWWNGRQGTEVPDHEDSGIHHDTHLVSDPFWHIQPMKLIVEEWRQATIKLPCVTDHTGGSIEHSPHLHLTCSFYMAFCSATQPFIRCSRFPRRSAQNMELHYCIPLHIRQSQTYSSFRRHLKTYYFLSAYPAPSGPCNATWFSSETLALYKSLTYLLNYLLT